MHTRWVLLATVVAALAGCATPAEQAARMEREMEHLVQIYAPACERLGFQRETDPWRNCVLRLAERESFERARYGAYPMTTTCFGHRGLLQCSTF